MTQKNTLPTLSDQKRALIIEAAITEFRHSGYDLTSMDRIALSAGVSKRTVYNHFSSKEELFTQILQQLSDRSVAVGDIVYRANHSLREQLVELAMEKLQVMQDENFVDLVRVALGVLVHSPEKAREVFSHISIKEEGIATWVRAAAADGRLETPDPTFAALQLQVMLKGFAFWPQVTMGYSTLTLSQQLQLAEQSVDMFLARYAK